MNAYELIEELEERYLQGCIYQEAANMLRQQADRIAEIEKVNFNKENPVKEVFNSEPVAWIEPDVIPLMHIIKAVVRREQDEQYSIPLYTTPQTKPLSDEEIKNLQAQCHLKNVGYDNFLMRFARAIEAKVRGTT
jgi:hypothetical protein